MILFDQIKKDHVQAMKDKDSVKKNVLSCVISSSQLLAKESKEDFPSDADVITVIKKLNKSNEEVVAASDNADAKMELEILNSYLPSQMSEDELRTTIYEFVALINPDDRKKSMGAVMKYLKEEFAGLYDGKMASSLAREVINENS